ncbi:MAG: hypothetical protein M4579_002331 [Chaenotheca gracillima]|nr:MAG: hypothetical protein M4579_002331 [Chaenotheca gracillima]
MSQLDRAPGHGEHPRVLQQQQYQQQYQPLHHQQYQHPSHQPQVQMQQPRPLRDDHIVTPPSSHHGDPPSPPRNLSSSSATPSDPPPDGLHSSTAASSSRPLLDSRGSRRKPAPSPLHAFETSARTPDRATDSSADPLHSLPFPRPPGGKSTINPTSSSSSSSPQVVSTRTVSPEQPSSPRERLDALLASEGSHYEPGQSSRSLASNRGNPTGTAPVQYSSPQVRNFSAPLPSSRQTEAPANPATMATAISSHRADIRPVPRTSSIDSAISSISSASHSHKSSQDSASSSPTDIANLISAAGSAEAAIQYLLKEKQSAAAQNAQLWRLVDKQRTMILGLNKDLERALKEKEKYRKKVKETMAQASSISGNPLADIGRADSESPAPSEPADPAPAPGKSMQEMISGGLRDSYPDMKKEGTAKAAPPADTREVKTKEVAMPSQDVLSQMTPIPSTARQDDLVKPLNLNLSKDNSTSGTEPAQKSPPVDGNRSPRGFAENRVQRSSENPSISLSEPSPRVERADIGAPPRKPPPAPLDLTQQNTPSAHLQQLGPDDHSDSDYEDILEVDEIPSFGRGRRKTRDEDDREREIALQKEQEHRSRSKKEKSLKSKASSQSLKAAKTQEQSDVVEPPPPAMRQAVSISPPAQLTHHLSPPDSLASVLNFSSNDPPQEGRRLVAPPPMSPGLPSSPRPMDRPMNSPFPRLPRDGSSMSSLASPPLSPRSGLSAAPLSPRAPRYPIPLPPNTPVSLASPGVSRHDNQILTAPNVPSSRLDDPSPEEAANPIAFQPGTKTIYRGLVSEQYPDMLLPPNALPSISVRVSSSRMKPARASFIPGKTRPVEDEAVFTLGVFARSDGQELWRLEKDIMSLPYLDLNLKKSSKFSGKLPDRGLFSGHAPAKIDARRNALDHYFEAVMNTPMDENSAVVVCRYLSTDAIEPADDTSPITEPSAAGTTFFLSSDAKSRKEGYLTKRGKNFGGWKARFFSLDGPVLNYYDAPGGHILGAIKLQHAQIGKQSSQGLNQSPSRNDPEDNENQYRHAFLILEPKKKDSNSLVRHVLCAENDSERDEWVAALLQYVDCDQSDDEKPGSLRKTVKSETLNPPQQKKSRFYGSKNNGNQSPRLGGDMDRLQAVSYKDTVEGEAPMRGSVQSARTTETPSPPTPGLQPPQSAKIISRPTNGAIIQDAESWGNKAPVNDKKEQKKRGIWGFRGRSSADLAISNQGHNEGGTDQEYDRPKMARAVFGAPLAEAAEFSRPFGVDVHLPAVVYRCIEYLDAKNAANEEGIFRLSGSNVTIKALRERFNTEGDVNFLAGDQYYDVHAVASLLKLYLRELPSTVLTRELHLDFLHVIVGIVFSPTLNIPAPVFSLFLTAFDEIFGFDSDSASNTPVESSPSFQTQSQSLTVDDIRSPRRQMFQDLPTPAYTQTNFPNPNNRASQHFLSRDDRSASYDTGFIPMQPSYEQQHQQPIFGGSQQQQNQNLPYVQVQGHAPAYTLSGTEYGSLNGAMSGPRPASSERERDTRAQRRESSMLSLQMGLGVPIGPGQRKSSMPQLRGDKPGMVSEESAFE